MICDYRGSKHNVQFVEIDKLVLQQSRVFEYDENHLDNIESSIIEYGLQKPGLADKDDNLWGGIHRCLACKRLGWTHFPVLLTTATDKIELQLKQLELNAQNKKQLTLFNSDNDLSLAAVKIARLAAPKSGQSLEWVLIKNFNDVWCKFKKFRNPNKKPLTNNEMKTNEYKAALQNARMYAGCEATNVIGIPTTGLKQYLKEQSPESEFVTVSQTNVGNTASPLGEYVSKIQENNPSSWREILMTKRVCVTPYVTKSNLYTIEELHKFYVSARKRALAFKSRWAMAGVEINVSMAYLGQIKDIDEYKTIRFIKL